MLHSSLEPGKETERQIAFALHVFVSLNKDTGLFSALCKEPTETVCRHLHSRVDVCYLAPPQRLYGSGHFITAIKRRVSRRLGMGAVLVNPSEALRGLLRGSSSLLVTV